MYRARQDVPASQVPVIDMPTDLTDRPIQNGLPASGSASNGAAESEPEVLFVEFKERREPADEPARGTTTDAPPGPPQPAERAGANGVPPEEAAPPGWFRRKAAPAATPPPPPPSRPRKAPPLLVIPADEPEAEPPCWRERLRQWGSDYGVALLVAFVFHLVLLVVMSLILLEESHRVHFEILASEALLEPEDFVEVGDVGIEFANNPEPEDERPWMAQVEVVVPDGELSVKVGLDLAGGIDEGADPGFVMRPGKNAVRKGSFTAWTVPEDPHPGQDYQIYIQVEFPAERAELKRYSLDDISGQVIGTDGWRQRLPWQSYARGDNGGPVQAIGRGSRRHLPVSNGTVQFNVTVPGASALVEDTIQIQSRMLREKQTLKIVF